MISSKHKHLKFRPFTKQITDVTPARKAAIKAQKVTKPKKVTLEVISMNESVSTPKKEVLSLDTVKVSSKRKRETPGSKRSTRSRFIEETPLSTRSERSTRSRDIKEKNSLNDFFQDDENVFDDENVLKEQEDTTWLTKIWKGVISTVFFM